MNQFLIFALSSLLCAIWICGVASYVEHYPRMSSYWRKFYLVLLATNSATAALPWLFTIKFLTQGHL